MSILENCEPQEVFSYFEQICAIPHGSGNTKAISNFCVEFAREHSLDYKQDTHHNIIIRKPAAAGYEHAPTLILQGHLDMVCVKEQGCAVDFMKDGLDVAVEGDFVYAKGTSLGGDDGIAVAMILALLADDTLPHPALEALFTVDEETGMYGAEAVDFSDLKGRWLINIDSEEEGVITAGCAGGVRANCLLPVRRRLMTGIRCTLTVDGLKGGHSGGEIDKGRASANGLLGRVLRTMWETAPYGIVTMEGGTVENAISSKAAAEIIIEKGHLAKLTAVAEQYDAIYRHEYATADGNVRLTITAGGEETLAATDGGTTDHLTFAMLNLPYGVQAMSTDIPGLVQTSLNMGVLRMTEDQLRMSFAVRSSVASQKQWLCQRLESIMRRVGGKVEFCADYPAWEFRRESRLRGLVERKFTESFGKAPKITATHGGLECGLFCGKAPDLDCVSIGPNLYDVHSPAERLSISSTARTYQLLRSILEDCGEMT